MGRLVGSVVLGYLVMFVLVFLTFTGLYLVMGVERSFQPGTYDASWLWIGLSIPLAIVAAIVGGWACAAVARSGQGPRALAGFVLVLGLLMAILMLRAPAESPPRTGAVGSMEAMQQARQPIWIALLNPFLGAIGVMIGGRRRALDVAV